MERHVWDPDVDAGAELAELCDRARTPAVLIVEFAGSGPGMPFSWRELEPWTTSRAVTVADVCGVLTQPVLDVALCCDLVYLRAGAELVLPGPDAVPSGGAVWAMARAGRAALARGMLTGGVVSGDEAVRLGLAWAVIPDDRPLPLPGRYSLAALTTARDLMRSRATGVAGLALELASFRLLFAQGDPEEGARAFLERRRPEFGITRPCPEKPGE